MGCCGSKELAKDVDFAPEPVKMELIKHTHTIELSDYEYSYTYSDSDNPE